MNEQTEEAISGVEEDPSETFLDLNRLQALQKLTALPVQSIRASRVVVDAATALNAFACIIHRLGADAKLEIIALHKQRSLDEQWLRTIAGRAADEVFSAAGPTRIDNLAEHYADEVTAESSDVSAYLGVPFFDSKGKVIGVMAVLSSSEHKFIDEDEWWFKPLHISFLRL